VKYVVVFQFYQHHIVSADLHFLFKCRVIYFDRGSSPCHDARLLLRLSVYCRPYHKIRAWKLFVHCHTMFMTRKGSNSSKITFEPYGWISRRNKSGNVPNLSTPNIISKMHPSWLHVRRRKRWNVRSEGGISGSKKCSWGHGCACDEVCSEAVSFMLVHLTGIWI
jgi:hypothetical protein